MQSASEWVKEQKKMLVNQLKKIGITKRTWRHWQLDTEWARDELIGVAEMEMHLDVFEDWYCDEKYNSDDFVDLIKWQAAYNETESGFPAYTLSGKLVDMNRYTSK